MNQQTQERNARLGFTLVEVLAALTLTSLLMALVFGFVVRLKTTSEHLQRNKPYVQWHSHLVRRLQEDYAGCRLIDLNSTSLIFAGYSQANDGLFHPSTIAYRIAKTDNGSLLVRDVEWLGSPLGTLPEHELVCRGVSAIRRADPWSKTVAPGSVRLQLFDADDEILIETTLVRHGVAND